MKKNLSTNYHLLTTKLKKWIRDNRWEAALLFVALLVAAFLRLYRIGEYMTFLGDEGRDAIIVRRLLVDFDPILIGPGTSIGNMYLGPLYYYLIAPSLLLANFSPVGPSVFIALLGVATCFFVWYVAREWFGKIAAIVALIFYAISPVVIIYSRSSWNPNIMPFFSLLCIYAIWKVWDSLQEGKKLKKKLVVNFKWLVVLGILYAFVLQSHYLGLLLAPVIFIYWFLTLLNASRLPIQNHKPIKKDFIKNSLIGLGVFAVLMSPLVIFDARHGWNNYSAIKKFFLERQTTVSARPWNAIPKLYPLTQKILTRTVAATNEVYGKWVVIIFWFGVLLVGMRLKSLGLKNRKNQVFLLLIGWLGVSLIGLGLYKQEIYDHYYGFFLPAIFIFIGGFIQIFLENRRISFFHYLVGLVLFVLIVINFKNNPLKYAPNNQLRRAQKVAQLIGNEAGYDKFNLAVIAERNYEDGYQYFLEKDKKGVFDIDPLDLENTLADTLYVVCELPKDKCDPTHNPKAQIANFGWSKVEGEWDLEGVTVYKLVHTN